MIPRYALPEITQIFCDMSKLNLWQDTELAVIEARVKKKLVSRKDYNEIKRLWLANPIDLEWWKKRDDEIHHDLNAFLDERYRHLPARLHHHVHKNITSYDTEEAPFVIMLNRAVLVIEGCYEALEETLINMALKYRYVIMNGRTHGQEAELQSFGARILTWLQDLRTTKAALNEVKKNLLYSKLSGAIGKYGSLNPDIEKEALKIMGLKPYYGATQIMPRVLFAPLAQALSNMVAVVDKIANDIRLSARSGRVLMQEPFKKKQKGSSAMPHKKNTIITEQIEGLAKMAVGYMNMITGLIKTWEERSIEQSSVERVAWPDLFQVTARALMVLNKDVLKNLKVYPDNMLKEIHESRGIYATSEIKEFLKENLTELSNEDIYRIVQLAAFNAFKPTPARIEIRETIPTSFWQSLKLLNQVANAPAENIVSLEETIPRSNLEFTDELDIAPEQIEKYNSALRGIFQKNGLSQRFMEKWHKLFTPEFLLKNEEILYQEILGVE